VRKSDSVGVPVLRFLVTLTSHPVPRAARKLWESYFPQVDAVIYLVDAMDKERFPEAKKELDVRRKGGRA
jgi:GTPase SAR1 family protein